MERTVWKGGFAGCERGQQRSHAPNLSLRVRISGIDDGTLKEFAGSLTKRFT
jgi:hypothetical protein